MVEPKEPIVQEILKITAQILEYNIEQLAERRELGEVNFQDGKNLFKKILELYEDLKPLPLELLPMDVLQQINSHTQQVFSNLRDISTFSLKGLQNPTQIRDEFLRRADTYYNSAFKIIAPWLGYLNLKSADAQETARRSKELLETARNQIEQELSNIAGKKQQVEETVQAIRKASAEVGVAQHGTRFSDVANSYGSQAKKWLKTACWLAGATVVGAVGLLILWHPYTGSLDAEAVQHIIGKFVIISILLTGAVWSARNYRSLKHLQVANEHRQHSLGTFETFVQATSDQDTKDAVLLETTKSIFRSTSSGFVPDGDENEPTAKVYEIVRNLKVPNISN